ncbi:MAG: hypothetical protein WBK08_13215 [Nitrospira sp.]
MSNRISIWFSVVLTLLLAYPAHAVSDHKDAGKHMVLNLVGTATAYDRTVPDIDGDGKDEPAKCFDVNLVDVHTTKVIGVSTDCFAQVTPKDLGLAMVTTTYFNFPSGTFIVRLNTSGQLLLHLQPTVTPSGVTMTHMSGAASKENPIIGGTGRFARETGTARLSGLLNMERFSMEKGGPVTFDCLFVIDLD